MLWCADRYAVHRCFMFQPLIINNHRCFYRSRESHKHNGANKEWAIKIFPIKTVHFCCSLFLFVRLVLSTLSVISKIHRWTVMRTFVLPFFLLVRFAKKIQFVWMVGFLPAVMSKSDRRPNKNPKNYAKQQMSKFARGFSGNVVSAFLCVHWLGR